MTIYPSNKVSTGLVVLAGAGVLSLLIYQVYLLFSMYPGHDQSWYLYGAQRMLLGVELYGPRLTETNPPLILWFSMLPALLARAFHLNPTAALRLVTLALAAASLAWCLSILRRLASAEWKTQWAAAYAIAITVFEINLYDFGQREQLLVLFTLPYIIAAAASAARRLPILESCLLGVAAGIGICFKPQQCLIVIGVELFLCMYRRSLRRLIRPKLLSLCLTGCVYLLLIRIATPLYLKEIVPLLLKTYWAFGEQSALHLAIADRGLSTLVTVAAFAVCVYLRRSLQHSVIPMALLCCSLAASVAFDLQHTGWVYQAYPCKAFLSLGISFLAIDWGTSMRIPHARPLPKLLEAMTAVLIVVTVSLGAAFLHRKSRGLGSMDRPGIESLLAPYPQGTTVYIFSTSLVGFSDVFEHNFVWGSRFAHLWMLPAIVQNGSGRTSASTPFKRLSPETVHRLSELQQADTVEDLALWRPVVILVERCTLAHPCGGLEGKNFDIAAWFSQSPAFAAEWTHYQRALGNTAFDVYRRTH